jgi:hypothetical protein
MKTLLVVILFLAVLLSVVQCRPIAIIVTPPPDATDAIAPPPSPSSPSDANDETAPAPCTAGDCCVVCTNLQHAGCWQPTCVAACQAALQFNVLDLTCLKSAVTLIAVRQCGLPCNQ